MPHIVRIRRWGVALSALLVLLAVFLPWMDLSAPTYLDQTPYVRAVRGHETLAGKGILILAGLGLVLAVRSKQAPGFVLLVIGTVIGGFVWSWYGTIEAWQYVSVLERDNPNPGPIASVGYGYYLLVIGAGSFIASSLLQFVSARWVRQPAQPTAG